MKNIIKILAFVVIASMTSNCATHIAKPKSAPTTSQVRFSDFKNVEMKAVGISPKFASSGANQKALKKIDKELSENLQMTLSNFKRLEAGEEFSKTGTRTLQITPYVKEIKFINGAVRFWVGAMAGSSAVLMQTTFVDSKTGKVIADPEFYRSANVFSGPFGIADNLMLDSIARDVSDYANYNK